MQSLYSISLKKIAVLAISAFAFVGIFGLYISISTEAHIDVAGFLCQQEQATSCQALTNHLQQWQQAFTATVSDAAILLLLAMVVTGGVMYLIKYHLHLSTQEQLGTGSSPPEFSNYLRQGFTEGTLQPIL